MTVGDETRRGPGRPRQTDQETARVRERIVSATEEAFARDGYRGVTVTGVIEEAGLTRTNFYRYFRGVDEPLRIVLDRFSQDLARTIAEAVGAVRPGTRSVIAGIDAYLDWSLRYRHLLPAVMTEAQIATSPVSIRRRQALDAIIALVSRHYLDSGRVAPTRSRLDTFVHSIEYTCLRLHLDTEGTQADIDDARETMLRISVAVLGGPRSWHGMADRIEQESLSGPQPDDVPESPPVGLPVSQVGAEPGATSPDP